MPQVGPYLKQQSFNQQQEWFAKFSKQGVWTPTLLGATLAGAPTYTAQDGVWYKLGDVVLASFRIATSAHTGTGNIRIGGFPFNFTNRINPNVTQLGSVSTNGIAGVAANAGYVLAGLTNTNQAQIIRISDSSALGMDADGIMTAYGSIIYLHQSHNQ